MDPLSIVLTIVAAILSVVLLVVGVQTILVLQEVRRSLRNFNRMTEVVEETVVRTLTPFQQLGGVGSGLRTGFRLLETFSTFIQSKQHETKSKSHSDSE
jgi:hypothetical protein